ncbi:hypothetical protein NC653_017171 [Populus alba x Populus x berolinensis]|uniref:Uncharacterized protein n=1 Tax=Populus alba x Populus x berolinensis TaxID=444605 RepID=A0AAD6QPX8_9ROSI|nr:hypothetical protein NC653_017171 [Populus alba x Populus x berolinensis]
MLSHQLHHDMDPSSLMVLQPQGCSLVSIMKLDLTRGMWIMRLLEVGDC